MKKILALLLVLAMVLSFAACAKQTEAPTAPAETTAATQAPTTETSTETEPPAPAAMSHEEYMAAEMNSQVTVETYVQGHQSWWDNKVTVYCQSPDGAYFLYELSCSEEDAAKLTPGTKIRVTGFKGEWAGEVEIMEGTFEILEEDTYVAAPLDVTALLGTDEMVDHQNEVVSFKGMTVEEITYKNDEPGDDIYVTLSKDGVSYSFCVEVYLTGTDSDVYTAVGRLQVGDTVDVEAFLYWYEGMNPHITAITPAEADMTHADYVAAEMNDRVSLVTYVQGHQSWWDNKVTVYCQSPEGACFLYELACSQADAEKLVPGTKIRVSGFKGEWAGEVEIMEGTFEFVAGDSFVAQALDVTDLLGTDEMAAHQNELVAFKGMTVEDVAYKNGEPGDDIYVTLGKDGQSYSFCVEVYLTGPDSDVYTTVGELNLGDTVDVEGFLYWYEGMNPHITAISVVG